jgi:hypothetical protein
MGKLIKENKLDIKLMMESDLIITDINRIEMQIIKDKGIHKVIRKGNTLYLIKKEK